MLTDTETPSLKKPELPEPPRPYVKPAVERIPLSEARNGDPLPLANDGFANSS